MCAFVLHLSCCPVIYFYLKAHSNLNALRASNTNPANFMLHEITDSCERLFQSLVSVRKSQAIRRKKLSSVRTALAIRWKKMQSIPWKVFARHRLIHSRRIFIRSNSSDYPLENCHQFEVLGLSVRRKLQSVWTARAIPPFKTIVSRATVPNHFHPRRSRRKSCKLK